MDTQGLGKTPKNPTHVVGDRSPPAPWHWKSVSFQEREISLHISQQSFALFVSFTAQQTVQKMRRNTSSTVSTEEINPNSGNSNTDPFATPEKCRPVSGSGFSSARNQYISEQIKYFRSRRVIKDANSKPPVFKKNPGEKWLWIIPLTGFLVGLAVTGVLIAMTVLGRVSHTYCPVLDENFSTGTLNPNIWTQEVEVGGFG
jgi:hypothetical protein